MGAYTFQSGFWGGVFSPTTYTTMQSSAWDTLATWGQATVPSYNAAVTVRAGDTITVSGAAQCHRLIVEHGATLVIQAGAALAVGERVVNAGTLQHTQSVDGSGGTGAFLTLGDHRGVDLTTGNDLSSVTVTVKALTADESCAAEGAVPPAYAQRCFGIQTTHNLSATVRLWAHTAEVTFTGTSAVFRNLGSATTWTELLANASTGTSGDYVYAEADTPGFSNSLLAESEQPPTRVGLRAFMTQAGGDSFPQSSATRRRSA